MISFYGGRKGNSFIISKSYDYDNRAANESSSYQMMLNDFGKLTTLSEVGYGDYVLLIHPYSSENGKVYRRVYNDEPEYIGQFMGPKGDSDFCKIFAKFGIDDILDNSKTPEVYAEEKGLVNPNQYKGWMVLKEVEQTVEGSVDTFLKLYSYDYYHGQWVVTDIRPGMVTEENGEIFNDYFSNSAKIYAHAEGYNTKAKGNGSHSEGRNTKAYGQVSHAEGYDTTAGADENVSLGYAAHAEGAGTFAQGNMSHAEGQRTHAEESAAHAEGLETFAQGIGSHAEGAKSFAQGSYSHAEGGFTHAEKDYSHAEGNNTIASGNNSHSEGVDTKAIGPNSHAEGELNSANGEASHVEGYGASTVGNYSHAEGYGTIAMGVSSHAEGSETVSFGEDSHTEGASSESILNFIDDIEDLKALSNQQIYDMWKENNKVFALAKGDSSHIEGRDCIVLGADSHAEGCSSAATGYCSHAEGDLTEAESAFSHAEGLGTVAKAQAQHVQGMYNIEDTTNKYAHIVGWGSSDRNRKNIHTLDTQGNAWFSGDLKVDGDIKFEGDIECHSVKTEGSIDALTLTLRNGISDNFDGSFLVSKSQRLQKQETIQIPTGQSYTIKDILISDPDYYPLIISEIKNEDKWGAINSYFITYENSFLDEVTDSRTFAANITIWNPTNNTINLTPNKIIIKVLWIKNPQA